MVISTPRLTGVATSHVSIISDTESAANTTATGDDDEVKSKTSSQQPSPAPGETVVTTFHWLSVILGLSESKTTGFLTRQLTAPT